jgi:hypothetical protein
VGWISLASFTLIGLTDEVAVSNKGIVSMDVVGRVGGTEDGRNANLSGILAITILTIYGPEGLATSPQDVSSREETKVSR